MKGTKMFEQMLVKAEAEKVRLQDRIKQLNEQVIDVDLRILKLKTLINDIEAIKGIPSQETVNSEPEIDLIPVQTC